jgi:hypothetical protein
MAMGSNNNMQQQQQPQQQQQQPQQQQQQPSYMQQGMPSTNNGSGQQSSGQQSSGQQNSGYYFPPPQQQQQPQQQQMDNQQTCNNGSNMQQQQPMGYSPQQMGMAQMGMGGFDPRMMPFMPQQYNMGAMVPPSNTEMGKSDPGWALEKRRARNRITAAESRRKSKEEISSLREELVILKAEKQEKEDMIQYYRNRYENHELNNDQPLEKPVDKSVVVAPIVAAPIVAAPTAAPPVAVTTTSPAVKVDPA